MAVARKKGNEDSDCAESDCFRLGFPHSFSGRLPSISRSAKRAMVHHDMHDTPRGPASVPLAPMADVATCPSDSAWSLSSSCLDSSYILPIQILVVCAWWLIWAPLVTLIILSAFSPCPHVLVVGGTPYHDAFIQLNGVACPHHALY
jgi:hypothetical protein